MENAKLTELTNCNLWFVFRLDGRWLFARWWSFGTNDWEAAEPIRFEEMWTDRESRVSLIFETQKQMDAFTSDPDPTLSSWQSYICLAKGLKHQSIVLTRDQLLKQVFRCYPLAKASTLGGYWFLQVVDHELERRKPFAVPSSLFELKGSSRACFREIIQDEDYRLGFLRSLADEDRHIEGIRGVGPGGVPVTFSRFKNNAMSFNPGPVPTDFNANGVVMKLGRRWVYAMGSCRVKLFDFVRESEFDAVKFSGASSGYLTEQRWPVARMFNYRRWSEVERQVPLDVHAAA